MDIQTINSVPTAALDSINSSSTVVIEAKKEQLVEPSQKLERQQQVEKDEVKQAQSEKQAENLQGAVSQINDYVQNLQRNLQFTIDELSGKDVITVIDSESLEVIRQIPNEEALELARRLAANKEDGVQLISTQV